MSNKGIDSKALRDPNFIRFYKAMEAAFKHDPSAGPTVPTAYGDGGVFNYAYGRPELYSAIPLHNTFIGSLAVTVSPISNEVISIVTGQSDTAGTAPTDFCGVPATAGTLYRCNINRMYGALFLKTQKVAVPDVGGFDTYGVPPQTVLNYAQSNSPYVPEPLRSPNLNPLNDHSKLLWQLGNDVQRAIQRIEVTGAAGASSRREWIKDYDGLQRVIKDGYVSADTSVACPAADSFVDNWGDASFDATVNGLTLPQLIHDLVFSRQTLADDVGLNGTQWALVMDRRLFRNLTFIFACAYAFTRCGFTPDAGSPIPQSATEILTARTQMQQGQFLLIEGQQIPVLFTSGAEVENDGGTLNSSLFCVPMSWQGKPLTYMQHFPMNNADIRLFNEMGAAGVNRFATNGGLYLFATRSDGFCDELLVASKMRLMCDVPFLGFRIDGIEYTGYEGYRDTLPGLSSFVSGGVSGFSPSLSGS
jgi:hypothetical protein